MARDPLNFFEPWHQLPAHHENQLTRGLLVILRCSAIAHQLWLTAIQRQLRPQDQRQLPDLPPASFNTQRRRILRENPERDEPIEGISVLIAAEDPQTAAEAMTEREGDQVLDGVIEYGDRRVVVIESKLDGPVSTRQHEQINLYGQPVAWLGPPVSVRWDDLVAGLSDLVAKGLVGGAEREVISDFLFLVDAHFPRIGPFTTLARCGQDEFRIQRRLARILNDLRDGEPGTMRLDLPEQTAVRQAYLDVHEKPTAPAPSLGLYMWPADTLAQARAFYPNDGAVDGLVALRDEGWDLEPNLHFSYMATGLVWPATVKSHDVDEYVAYWQEHIDALGRTEEADWDGLWERLRVQGFVAETDRPDFDRHFTHTNRTNLNPCPGLLASYVWPLADAVELDDDGRLTAEVRRRINQLLVAIGEPPLR